MHRESRRSTKTSEAAEPHCTARAPHPGMASGDLYEVERIVDKRRNKKGKWEYLIRWKGYGSSEDTWEPENHLLHCEEFIDQFNSLRLQRDKRPRPARPSEAVRGRGEARRKKRSGTGVTLKPRKISSGTSKQAGDRVTKTVTYRTASGELQPLPVQKVHNGVENGDINALDYDGAAPVDKMMQDLDVTKTPLLNEIASTLSNGGMNLHSSVKRKLVEEKDYVFDKRLRYNIRQNESNCRFRDIVVRKEEGFTHVLLSSQTSDNNALTPEIMKEVSRALSNAATDSSKLLLLSAVGSVFCSGLDHSYLIGRLSTDRRKESNRIADAIRDFVRAFLHFKKPIVVAINGPALGLGASILPLCDIVWASEKAWFQTPCASTRLTPTGCSSYTFPQILGVALANEMLFCGRKLTAQEACSRGLVSQVFWPTTFSQEVMLRVREMATCSAVVLEESKCLVRSFLRSVLEEVNEKECQMLKQLWSSTKGLESLFTYLQEKICEA
ncbi:chromodomain Y-like protein 2 isoform X1 [Brienomyrus brachyistius]|uniref:chromodomain Y-like protein 2 isoform X1 n=2 Tax=Brienomyrus brachyistius TaxID=42636 RepID=UPI0020B4219A|nr:chromodomain Y-like protein 2 isoform X1 [Brienomyrus brachyistius]XP_048860964.1 chromodomain Y-like protein 2 isoform X1 [Brienomyrus brachyistius]